MLTNHKSEFTFKVPGLRLDTYELSSSNPKLDEVELGTLSQTQYVSGFEFADSFEFADALQGVSTPSSVGVLSGELQVEQAGTYRFFLGTDEAMTIRVGDDVRSTVGGNGIAFELELEAGSHDFEALFVDTDGAAAISMEYTGPDTNNMRMPLGEDVLSVSDPSRGARETLWEEDFNGLADGTLASEGAFGWTTTKSESAMFEAQGVADGAYVLGRSTDQGNADDATVTWSSSEIDISGRENVEISFDVSSLGDMESTGKWSDFLTVTAIVDGQEFTLLDQRGDLDGATQTVVFNDLPQGDTLRLEAVSKTTADEEKFLLDNVSIVADSAMSMAGERAIWSETFDDSAAGALADTGDTAWSVSLQADVSYAARGVEDGAYVMGRTIDEARRDDAVATWSSEAIDISGLGGLALTLDINSFGDMEDSRNWRDFLTVNVEVDGQRHELAVQNGNIDGDAATLTLTDLPEGDSLRIEIEGKTTADDEAFSFDNVTLIADYGVAPAMGMDMGAGHDAHGDMSHEGHHMHDETSSQTGHDGMSGGMADTGDMDDMYMPDGGMTHDHTTHDHNMDDMAGHDPAGSGHDMGGHDHGGHTSNEDLAMHAHPDDAGLQSDHSALLNLMDEARPTAITAKQSGDWFDPNTWHGGTVPGEDDNVVIPEGMSVSYGGMSDVRLMTVIVDGELHFDTDQDSQMIVDTILTSPKSVLTIGTEDNPVADDASVDIIFRSDTGSVTDHARVDSDPGQLGKGIVTHGTVRIYGEEKEAHLKVSDAPMTGDTELSFDEWPTGWEVGDRLVVTGSNKGQNIDGVWTTEDEIVTIKSISQSESGWVVELNEALVHDHDVPEGYEDQLAISVANTSRNVTFSSEYQGFEDIGLRGHAMFMHNPDVEVSNAGFEGMGRTDKSRPLDHLVTYDSQKPNGDYAIGTDRQPSDPYDIENQPGRYALHVHRTGAEKDAALLEGNVVWESPGWGVVHHDSNADVVGNVTYGVRGGAIVAESGSETGSWVNNLTINTSGTGGINIRQDQNRGELLDDSFHQGVGFGFKSRLLENEGNIAVSAESTGYAFRQKSVINEPAITSAYVDANGYDPFLGVQQFEGTHGPTQIPTRDFLDNEVYASEQGFFTTADHFRIKSDVTSLVEGFVAWEVDTGVRAQYQSDYVFKDNLIIGAGDPSRDNKTTGFFTESGVFEFEVINTELANLHYGANGNGGHNGQMNIETFTGTRFEDVNYEIQNFEAVQLYDEDAHKYEDLSQFNLTLSMEESVLTRDKGQNIKLVAYKTDSSGTYRIEQTSEGGNFWDVEWANEYGYYTRADGTPVLVLELGATDTMTGSIGVLPVVVELNPDRLSEAALNLGHIDEDLEDGVGDFQIVDVRRLDHSGDALDDGFAGTLLGTEQADLLEAGSTNDLIYAGSGNDTVKAGDGDDWIKGSGGDDRLEGGHGADTFVFGRGDGADVIVDYSRAEGDTIDLSPTLDLASAQVSQGEAGLRIDFGTGDVITVETVFSVDDVLWL